MAANYHNTPTEPELEELVKLVGEHVQVTVHITEKDDFNELISRPVKYKMKLAVVKPEYIEGWLLEPYREGLSFQAFQVDEPRVPYRETVTCIRQEERILYEREADRKDRTSHK